MKKIVSALSILLFTAGMSFAQSNDLQVLTIVKYNKSESITVKQLKTRCDTYEKQLGQKLTLDQKKQVLSSLVDEKLVLQAAAKAGIVIPDSTVDQFFLEAMSQSVGATVTEKQLNDYFKTQGTTLDAELLKQTGMNVADYKVFLKNQLIAQQYVIQVRQEQIQAVAPSDAEIRALYEGNKASFVWNDMVRLCFVGVAKGSNADDAKNKCNELRNKYIDKKITKDQLLAQAQLADSGYSAEEGLLPKTEAAATQVQLTYASLLGLYEMDVGYISDVTDRSDAYIFIILTGKYAAKMLTLSDVVSPDSTTTVYEYIRQNLAQQKAQTYIQQAAQEVADELRKPEYIEEKKTGAALDKLLNWGE